LLPLTDSGESQTQKAPRFRITGKFVGLLRLNFLGGAVAAGRPLFRDLVKR